MIKYLNKRIPRDVVSYVLLPMMFDTDLYCKLMTDIDTLNWIHKKYFTTMTFSNLYFGLYLNITRKKKNDSFDDHYNYIFPTTSYV